MGGKVARWLNAHQNEIVKHLPMFLMAWLQVSLISANTWFIASAMLLPALVCGFLISLVWTLNVKRVAFGGWSDRFVYASGACLGTATGLLIATILSDGVFC